MLYCYISPGMQGAIFYYPLPPNQLKLLILHPPPPYGLLDLIPHMVSGSNMCSFNSEASPTVNIVRYWCRILLTNLQKSDSLHFKKCTALKFNCKNVQKVSNPVPNFFVHQTLT